MLFLAWARLRYRPARRLLVCLGVATASVLPVLAEGSSAIVTAQSLRHGVERLEPGQRSLIVSYSALELPAAELASLDRATRDLLSSLTVHPTRAQLLFRRIADGAGGTYFFGAADDLRSAVRLTSGRLPEACTPQRCEVVIAGDGTPQLDPALGLVVVGRAVPTDPLLLTGTFDPGHDAPLLLADGVDRATRLASLGLFQRSYGWVAPIDLDRVDRFGVDAYLAHSARVSDELRRVRPGLVLTAPDDVLRTERDRAQRSTRRFALFGGSGTVLLLGFAVIGAIGLRRDHTAVTELVRRRGSPLWRVRMLTTVEAVVPVAAGAALGVLVGAGLTWFHTAKWLPAWSTATGAVAAAGPFVLLSALAAAVLVFATLAWAGGTRSHTAWRAVDLTVLAGVTAAGLAFARGAVTAGSLDARTDPLLLALPVICASCGGLLVARVWPFAVSSAARFLPARWLALRLGLLGVLRRPLRPVATTAFLAAATAVVAFAAAYQATLRQGAADQAAFAVPLDARITTGRNLERPLDLAPAARFAATAPGVTVHPVVRAAAGVQVNATERVTAEVVGVDPAALPRIRSWTRVAGGTSAADAARLLAETTPAEPAGIALPQGARAIAFPAAGDLELIQVVAWLRLVDGRDAGVALRSEGGRLVGTLPTGQPARLFAFTLAESTGYATLHQHKIGEGNTDSAVLAGRVVLGAPEFAEAPSSAPPAPWTGWVASGGQVNATGSRLSISYAFTGARVVVRAGTATAPLPVLADPDTARRATNGLMQLVVNGNEPVPARVVAVIPRFPTAGARFIVADNAALAEALDAREPGTGSMSELWLWAPDAQAGAMAQTLAAAPYDRLTVDLRQVRQAWLTGDPVGRGAAGLLTSNALLALVAAVLALVLLVVAERRDDSQELYTWESDGVAPATLRRALFVRAAAVVAVAVPGGLLVGVALSRLTSTLVLVTAVGTTPVPPLALAIDPGWIATVIAVGLAIGLAASGAVAAAALREPMPPRPEESL